MYVAMSDLAPPALPKQRSLWNRFVLRYIGKRRPAVIETNTRDNKALILVASVLLPENSVGNVEKITRNGAGYVEEHPSPKVVLQDHPCSIHKNLVLVGVNVVIDFVLFTWDIR